MATMVKTAEVTGLRESSVISTQEWVDDVVLDLLPRQGQWTEEGYL